MNKVSAAKKGRVHSDDDKTTYKKLLQSQMTWFRSAFGYSHGIRAKQGKTQIEEAEINSKCMKKERLNE